MTRPWICWEWSGCLINWISSVTSKTEGGRLKLEAEQDFGVQGSVHKRRSREYHENEQRVSCRSPSAPLAAFVRRAPHSTAARAGTRPTSHYLSPQTSLLPASGGPHHYRDPGWSRFVWHSATCMPYASVCPQWSTTFTCLGVRGSQVGPLHLLLLATIAKTEAPFLHLHFARW